jgi:hypothetical protein
MSVVCAAQHARFFQGSEKKNDTEPHSQPGLAVKGNLDKILDRLLGAGEHSTRHRRAGEAASFRLIKHYVFAYNRLDGVPVGAVGFGRGGASPGHRRP